MSLKITSDIRLCIRTISVHSSRFTVIFSQDCLAVHHDPGQVMEDLKSCYKLKNDTYGGLRCRIM